MKKMRFKFRDFEFELTYKMALAFVIMVVAVVKSDDILTVENFQAIIRLFG